MYYFEGDTILDYRLNNTFLPLFYWKIKNIIVREG